jgi:hypothetical protein
MLRRQWYSFRLIAIRKVINIVHPCDTTITCLRVWLNPVLYAEKGSDHTSEMQSFSFGDIYTPPVAHTLATVAHTVVP